MSKGLKIGLIILAVVLVLVFSLYNFFVGTYNSIVKAEEGVKSAWSQVENVYQRRFDLIPNLVNTVKGYASHESKVFTDIAQAQSELGSALQRLLVITENYPELKANQNFMDLQTQLEGTENRIAVERKRYNEAVQSYNVYIRQFPRSIIANMNGFREKAYFRADDQASTAPKVNF